MGIRSSSILERGEVGFSSEKMSWAHWVGVVLAAVTGGIHVFLYFEQGFVPFLFAGVVFLVAAIAVLFDVYRRLLYVVGIPFVAGQIATWYMQGMPDMAIAAIDKPIQVLLVLLLGYLFLNEDQLTAGTEGPAGAGERRTVSDEGRSGGA